jgi:uncharacterized membrane protein HdeD (DUF308 family)
MTSADDAIAPPMIAPFQLLCKSWWLVLLRGLSAIAFGLLAILWPGLSLFVLILLYGVYALADGVFALIGAIRGGGIAPRWWLALVALVSAAAGVVALFWPGLTALVLVLLIGAWSIMRGAFEIIGAIQLRKEIRNEWLLIAGGILSILVGLLLVVAPGAGALALIWVIGAYAVAFGVLLTILAFRLRKLRSA